MVVSSPNDVFKPVSVLQYIHVHVLQDYPLKEILSGPYLLEDYDPSKIDMVLEKLVPETIR